VNKLSRKLGLQIYRRGGFGLLASGLHQEYWTPSLDVLYIPRFLPPGRWPRSQRYKWYEDADLSDINADEYNFPTNDDFSDPAVQLSVSEIGSIRHLAVPFDHQKLNAFFQGDDYALLSPDGAGGFLAWLASFPTLLSVTVVIHPGCKWWIYDPREMTLVHASDDLVEEPLGCMVPRSRKRWMSSPESSTHSDCWIIEERCGGYLTSNFDRLSSGVRDVTSMFRILTPPEWCPIMTPKIFNF
jgi:hypothetical protein